MGQLKLLGCTLYSEVILFLFVPVRAKTGTGEHTASLSLGRCIIILDLSSAVKCRKYLGDSC
jgi:hypothetical protein